MSLVMAWVLSGLLHEWTQAQVQLSFLCDRVRGSQSFIKASPLIYLHVYIGWLVNDQQIDSYRNMQSLPSMKTPQSVRMNLVK